MCLDAGTDKKTPSGGWLSGWFGKSLRAETAGPSGVDKADGHSDDTKQGTATATDKPNGHKQAEHVTVPRKGEGFNNALAEFDRAK